VIDTGMVDVKNSLFNEQQRSLGCILFDYYVEPQLLIGVIRKRLHNYYQGNINVNHLCVLDLQFTLCEGKKESGCGVTKSEHIFKKMREMRKRERERGRERE
jgi:hypothetical protein